ncbi:MAG TPA: formate dehydrogenase subunit gamma [Hyphomicrobiales bacterium]|nr:formate dehydrogenase subunit gamma [Hyphomicrobiales bacterium]
MAEYEPWSEERGRAVIAAEAKRPGALLPVLHAVQQTFGFVPDAAVVAAADILNLTRAEVHGVASFYHDFKTAPQGRHVLKLCRAEACQSMGTRALADQVRARLGIDFGETTPDGRVTLEEVYCLGLCACAPSAMLDGELHARLDAESVDALVREAQA